MSVMIPEMDMPQCCIDCPIYNDEFGECNLIPNSRFYNTDTDEELYDPFKARNKDCPLQEIIEI